MTDIDLSVWASDSPALQVPDELLKESIQRAMIDLALRHEQEYELFKKSEFSFCDLLCERKLGSLLFSL